MEEYSDEHILQLLQESTRFEEGFRLLVRQYQERLYWLVRKMVLNHDDTNDVLQNVFIKVHRNIQQFEGKSKLYTWLYRIATNETLTFLDRQKKRKVLGLEDTETNIANNLQADEYFDGDEAQIKLQIALKQLPPKQQLVFSMRYYEELSYNEISQILETSVGALKASYHHAVKKVETHLRLIAED